MQTLSLAKHGKEVTLLPTAHACQYLLSAAGGREEAACLCCWELAFRERQQTKETLYQIKEEVIKNYLFQRYMQITELFFVYPKCDDKKKIKVRISTNS